MHNNEPLLMYSSCIHNQHANTAAFVQRKDKEKDRLRQTERRQAA